MSHDVHTIYSCFKWRSYIIFMVVY